MLVYLRDGLTQEVFIQLLGTFSADRAVAV